LSILCSENLFLFGFQRNKNFATSPIQILFVIIFGDRNQHIHHVTVGRVTLVVIHDNSPTPVVELVVGDMNLGEERGGGEKEGERRRRKRRKDGMMTLR
jgi:hypothetical protein